ncbi:MAG: RlmE family RNA methyltransferase [Treponema sp.]|jgi:23S rRNA (uridine2552-2'-O)-methyltransferase|nr:RlmE family RNA methyltransferase [Treponema sp.]
MKTPAYKKPDYWSLKAQKEGYPARSVYKLAEIDEKFGLLAGSLRGGGGVLDLGAAPGSWCLYVLRKYGASRGGAGVSLTAVDLAPLSHGSDGGLFGKDNFLFMQGDIVSEEIRTAILRRGPYRLLLSDAAPATSGNRSLDTLRSLELAETVLGYAETALEKGSSMVVKVFQGGDSPSVLARIRELFAKGRSFKPGACRGNSFETYYLGFGKK